MPFLKKRPWIAIALVIACICMWGCGLLDEEVNHVVDSKRYNGIVFAIIDDSLALETNGRRWTDHTEHCDYWEDCETGTINQGVFLVNYRNKQKPLWGDTIDGAISIVYGYYHDSSAMFSNADDEFGFWRIGEKPRVVRKWNCEAPCECNREKYGRLWTEGNVLLKMVQQDGCPYAVLDTATGNVRKLEFTGDYAWLEGCDDITYIDGDVVCIRHRENRLCEVNLERDKNVVDSLIKDEWMLFDPPEFHGNAIKVKARSFDKNDHAYDFGDRLMLFGSDRIVFDEYPETWLRSNAFIDSMGTPIGYSSEDLIVTK
ncbi:hypothetical protein [uncultured Fibrobacter sp.]|uniref:hypothetical protein n=1 Tax=uncultured Fibrobacter sp. TaxID=261512 RepID=UPI0025F00607|nr:hypothetical protein [uncultured Fibrobacter sp.]